MAGAMKIPADEVAIDGLKSGSVIVDFQVSGAGVAALDALSESGAMPSFPAISQGLNIEVKAKGGFAITKETITVVRKKPDDGEAQGGVTAWPRRSDLESLLVDLEALVQALTTRERDLESGSGTTSFRDHSHDVRWRETVVVRVHASEYCMSCMFVLKSSATAKHELIQSFSFLPPLIQAHAALKEAESVIISVRALLALEEAGGDTTEWEGALKNAEDCRHSLDTHHVRIALPPFAVLPYSRHFYYYLTTDHLTLPPTSVAFPSPPSSQSDFIVRDWMHILQTTKTDLEKQEELAIKMQEEARREEEERERTRLETEEREKADKEIDALRNLMSILESLEGAASPKGGAPQFDVDAAMMEIKEEQLEANRRESEMEHTLGEHQWELHQLQRDIEEGEQLSTFLNEERNEEHDGMGVPRPGHAAMQLDLLGAQFITD